LITYPYLTRILGPERLGAVQFVDYTMGLIYSIATIGIPAYGMYRIAQLQSLGIDSRKLYRSLTGWSIVLSLLGYGLFFLLTKDHSGWFFIHEVIPMGALFIFANSLSAEWYLQGKERFDIPAIRNLALRLLGLIAIIALIKSPSDYKIYYWIITITICLSALVNTLWIRNDLLKHPLQEANESFKWKELFLFYIGTVFISCTDFLDVTLLGVMSSEEQIGLYGNAAKLIRLSLLLPMALNLVVSPKFSGHHAKGNSMFATALLDRSISWITYLAIPISVLYLLYAKELVWVFSGSAFTGSIQAIRWMSGIPLFISLSNLLIYYGLSETNTKNKRSIAIGVGTGITISIGLNYWLIPLFGAIGAAMNSLLIEFGFMLFFLLLLKPSIDWKTQLKTCMTCLAFIPIYIILDGMELSNLVRLLLGGCTSGVIYLFIQHKIWNHPYITEISKNQ
jgi:O-antigen/teichoic acid export membrane protein